MKRILVLIALTAVAAACGSSSSRSAQPVTAATFPERPPNVLFGHIESLKRTGQAFELKFDPAWWLSGVAAQRAALEDTGSSDVPNDHYIVDESHRLLTFVVPADAHVTVVTHRQGTGSVAISSSELAEIVQGRNPEHRPIFSSKLPFWIRIGEKYPNPALTLDQQYQP
jgi:hypothetical protein